MPAKQAEILEVNDHPNGDENKKIVNIKCPECKMTHQHTYTLGSGNKHYIALCARFITGNPGYLINADEFEG